MSTQGMGAPPAQGPMGWANLTGNTIPAAAQNWAATYGNPNASPMGWANLTGTGMPAGAANWLAANGNPNASPMGWASLTGNTIPAAAQAWAAAHGNPNASPMGYASNTGGVQPSSPVPQSPSSGGQIGAGGGIPRTMPGTQTQPWSLQNWLSGMGIPSSMGANGLPQIGAQPHGLPLSNPTGQLGGGFGMPFWMHALGAARPQISPITATPAAAGPLPGQALQNSPPAAAPVPPTPAPLPAPPPAQQFPFRDPWGNPSAIDWTNSSAMSGR